MRGLRYDRILAGTALALVLAVPFGANAQTTAAVPLPDQAVIAPPTGDDLTPPITTPSSNAVTPANPPAAAPANNAATPKTEPAGTTETAAEPAPDPFASLDPADRPIAEKVRDLLAAKTDKIFGNKKERSTVEAFYQNRKNALLWIDKGVVNARAKAVVARMNAADADGLEANDYRAPSFETQSADALAEAELRLTQTVLTFARHLQAGRFPYARISKDIEVPQLPPEQSDVLAKVADATNAGKALDEYSPPHPAYRKLKAALAELRTKAGGNSEKFADGPVLKLQKVPMEDPRVPLLRERLSVPGDQADQRYDTKVAEAVKKYQRANELPVTGALDSKTVKELNGPPRDKQIDLVLVNMERWRWYPRDLKGAHVQVNIPEYQLRVFKGEDLVWNTRIVVGKPGSHATPLLYAQMKYITVNPTWNVPPSIVNNEYLPALAQDPTVLTRMGLKVVNNRDGSVHIYQPPGEGNALGRVRFNFPNRFLVYQHDTPDKHLFAHDARAYSHGCMRVQDPAKYAEVLLNIARPSEGWTADRIKKMYGTSEQDIQFPSTIPVNLTYQTASVDEAGQLQIRKDIYSYDARMLNAIKNDRGNVEMAEERVKERTGSTTTARPKQPQPKQVGFFEALFGGGNQPAGNRPVPPNRIR